MLDKLSFQLELTTDGPEFSINESTIWDNQQSKEETSLFLHETTLEKAKIVSTACNGMRVKRKYG